MTVRVVVCDDSELLRTALALLLETDPAIDVVGDAAHGEIAVALAHQLRPHVVLMDVRMPGTGGIEATRRIVDQLPDVRVLVLTGYDDPTDVVACLRAGASGFLLKDNTSTRLLDAVHTVAAGHTLLDPAVTDALLRDHVLDPGPPGRADPTAALTARERQILTLVGHGHTNTEIAAALFLAESTVKTYVSRLFTKLDLRDRAHAVVLAHRCGLVRDDRA